MKKRLLSLLLVLVMVLSLFPVLTAPAAAAGDITKLFDRYVSGDKIDEFFDEDEIVATGSCGKDGQGNVMYKIYRVDASKIKDLKADTSVLEANEYLAELRDKVRGLSDTDLDTSSLLSSLDFDLDETETYYAVKIFGSGEMDDYTLRKTAPWGGNITVDGEVVDLEEVLIAAYIEGPNADKGYTGVTNVGRRAFFGQDKLSAVYLGSSITTIGEKAFETCDQLAAINFPDNLETIQRRAFYACDYLTFVRMGSCHKLKKIEERAFCTCSRLTVIQFPNNSLTDIGDFAFAWDHVLGTAEFALPASLERIGVGAFSFCTHLGVENEVVIPQRVTRIGEWAFTCNFDLKELVFSPGGQQALTIGAGAFAGNRAMVSITFPNRVRTIGDYAFAACDKLEQVSFGDKNGTEALHTAVIGDRAFDSLEETGLCALRAVADNFRETDDGEYIDGSREVAEGVSRYVDQLTGITPLKQAAFGSIPPTENTVVAATDAMHSFPKDVTICYPSAEYSASMYALWQAAVTRDGKWQGYNAEPTWMGHFHVYGDPQVVERTCTEDGYSVYTCTYWDAEKNAFCGHVEEVVQANTATGHKAQQVRIIQPTCTTDGTVFYHCDNAWCVKPDYTETIPATGHNYNQLSNRQYLAPTCTTDGYIRGVCPDCGQMVDEVLPATGHDTTYMNVVTAPTCERGGVYQGDCPNCGRRNVRQEVPALGHDWDDGHWTRRPTQTTDGEKTYICQRDASHTKTEVVPKLVHTHIYATTVVDPTCTEEGYTAYTCTAGDDSYNDNYVPAKGHTWDNGVVTVLPTATSQGVRTYTCSVCGSTRVEAIPAGSDPTPKTFTDVASDAYYAAAVQWAVEQGVTQGTSDTTFSPDDSCTRAQAVTFLYRAAGSPSVSGNNPFTDVNSGDYFYNAVLWAVQQGITQGTSPTTFSPYDTCTRAHIVTFLYRAKHSPTVSNQGSSFTDVPSSQWYAVPVLWAVQTGVTKGTSDTTFSPDNNCTRGQIVTFLHRDRMAAA